MDPILVQTLLFAAFATLASASGATKIYINQVSAYSSLAQCAEPEVSTIVRDMSYGCGDGSRTTSYACFCYQSSSEFSSMIENHVSTACSADSSQATLAVQVFSDYCQLGEIAAIQTSMEHLRGTVSLLTNLQMLRSLLLRPRHLRYLNLNRRLCLHL
jgi:hypothetical protein